MASSDVECLEVADRVRTGHGGPAGRRDGPLDGRRDPDDRPPRGRRLRAARLGSRRPTTGHRGGGPGTARRHCRPSSTRSRRRQRPNWSATRTRTCAWSSTLSGEPLSSRGPRRRASATRTLERTSTDRRFRRRSGPCRRVAWCSCRAFRTSRSDRIQGRTGSSARSSPGHRRGSGCGAASSRSTRFGRHASG